MIGEGLIREIEGKLEAKLVEAMSNNDKLEIVTEFDAETSNLITDTYYDGQHIKSTITHLEAVIDAIVDKVRAKA